MLRPEIDWNLCQGCDPCLARSVCRTRAIVQIDPGDSPYIEYPRCSNCALCVAACCCNAISMKNLTASVGSVFDFR